MQWTLTRRRRDNDGALFRTVQDLEEALHRSIAVMVNDDDNEDCNDDDYEDKDDSTPTTRPVSPRRQPSICYCVTPDLSWLGCRRWVPPKESDRTSVTGLCGSHHPTLATTALHFSVWTIQLERMPPFRVDCSSSSGGAFIAAATTTITSTTTSTTAVTTDTTINGTDTTNMVLDVASLLEHQQREPHNWTRRTLSYLSPSSSHSHHRENTSERLVGATVQWINMRLSTSNNNNNNDPASLLTECLETSAGIYEFLQRILLGDDTTEGSPWVTSTTLQDDSAAAVHPPPVECVMLAVYPAAPEALVSFRVSDACPSWCLYSTVLLHTGRPSFHDDTTDTKNNTNTEETAVPWSLCDTDTTLAASQQQQQQVQVLIYRRLPPRERLSSRHPVTSDPSPTRGCLWETVITLPETTGARDDDDDDEAEPVVTHRLVGPPYIDFMSEYVAKGLDCHLHKLLQPDRMALLRRDAARIHQLWTAWPEQQHYRTTTTTDDNATTTASATPWTVFPLCHTFPAHDLSRRQWIAATARHVPDTVALLQQFGGDWIRTALFSRLDPNSVLEAHTGWADLANHVYRIHIPIEIPDQSICGTWVDGCVVLHRADALVAFDDSKVHRAFHYTNTAVDSSKMTLPPPPPPPISRIVLIVDVARPSHLPLGTATGGHSEELDSFIAQFATL